MIDCIDYPQVNLVGKKVLNPMIHCCDQCLKPILIYGRMIPCKHVFCLGCAKQVQYKALVVIRRALALLRRALASFQLDAC